MNTGIYYYSTSVLKRAKNYLKCSSNHHIFYILIVLILGPAGTELTFFTAARVVLCFALVTQPVLVTHGCFGYWWTLLAQALGFLLLTLHAQPPPSWPKGYSMEYHVMLSRKTGIEEEKGGGGGVCLPKWLFLGGWLGTGLFVGGGGWAPCHHLSFFLFPLLTKRSLS